MYHSLSVIIPTRNRRTKLLKTLRQYGKQRQPRDTFEIILVDDGSQVPVTEYLDPQAYAFNLKILRLEHHAGPAAARNAALKYASHDVIVFTGDDIMPTRDFLVQPVRAHNTHPDSHIAILGYLEWAPNLKVYSLMRQVTEIGGVFFSFFRIQDHHNASYKYFFTSNISLKRDYLMASRERFCEKFTGAAHEDIELGYRLEKNHGLRVVFCKNILSYHNHGHTLATAYRRQFIAVQTAVLFHLLHPEIFLDEYARFSQHSSPISWTLPRQFKDFHRRLEKELAVARRNECHSRIFQELERRFFSEVLSCAFQSGGASKIRELSQP